MKEHSDLKCSVCGYIPDDDDLQKTNYKVATCDTCGQENVCDLCLFHPLESFTKLEDVKVKVKKTKCPSCSPHYRENGELILFGNDRKFWLQDEY